MKISDPLPIQLSLKEFFVHLILVDFNPRYLLLEIICRRDFWNQCVIRQAGVKLVECKTGSIVRATLIPPSPVSMENVSR